MRAIALIALSIAAASAASATEPPKDLPKGPLGEAVLRGYDMIVNTQSNAAAKAYVGNALNCDSCHTEGGTADRPGNFLTTATKFPSYSPREDTVLTLEDRIDNCFMRSMHGKRPTPDSAVTVDMAAYIAWVAHGKPLYGKEDASKPAGPDYATMAKAATHAEYANGGAIYAAKCAACHGADGQGTAGTFPPVWGERSYNAGAGLALVPKLAGWVHGNMPLGNAHLSPQEALAVALYIDAQPRADFNLVDHMPPGAAADADIYNAHVHSENDSVASNLHKIGLDLKAIRGE